MAYTFLFASGEQVGKSLIEQDRIEEAKAMLDAAAASPTDLLLPHDHVCVQEIAHGTPVQVTADTIPEGWMGADIGPETVARYTKILRHAKTIVWNGPMGVFEMEPFDVGTHQIADATAIATNDGAISIVGGGDSVAAVTAFGIEDQMTHISTGGGASLQMLEGKAFKSVAMLDDDV